jgi:hypothetical protein
MAAIELYEAMRTLRAVRRLRPDPIPDDVLRRVKGQIFQSRIVLFLSWKCGNVRAAYGLFPLISER